MVSCDRSYKKLLVQKEVKNINAWNNVSFKEASNIKRSGTVNAYLDILNKNRVNILKESNSFN